jgi:hypothetical protein
MKKTLLSICGFAMAFSLMAQEAVVLEQHGKIYEINKDKDLNVANKKGDRVDYDDYYTRRSGMQVDSLVVTVGQYKVALKPSSTNYLFWKEIGNWYPFWGDARVLGCRIGYAKRIQNESADNYDLSLYHASGSSMNVPDEPLAARSFAGYQITTGDDVDSFTYIEYKSSDYTTVKHGFMISVAMEDVTPFGDSTDQVSLYTSLKGDGKGEHRAMVRLTNESIMWQGTEFVPLDRAFSDGAGGFYEFDYDLMIIPIMDVESGIGFIDMKGLKYNGHYPNPAKNNFTIDLDVAQNQDNFKVSIQTIGGQTLRTMNTGFLAAGKQFVNVDVTGLAAGNYIYTIESDNSSVSSMVIVID